MIQQATLNPSIATRFQLFFKQVIDQQQACYDADNGQCVDRLSQKASHPPMVSSQVGENRVARFFEGIKDKIYKDTADEPHKSAKCIIYVFHVGLVSLMIRNRVGFILYEVL